MHDTDFALGKQIPIFEFDTEDESLADFRHTLAEFISGMLIMLAVS